MDTSPTNNRKSAPILEKVCREEEHARILYELLKRRSHNISHVALPTFEEHEAFVYSHPYRTWHLIKQDSEYVGTIYLLKSNHVGISVLPGYEHCAEAAISQITAHYRPLPAIKSVRAAVFAINIAPTNDTLIGIIEKMGGTLAQKTYVLPPGK